MRVLLLQITEALAKIQAGERFDVVNMPRLCGVLLLCAALRPCCQQPRACIALHACARMQLLLDSSQVATAYSEDAARKGGDLGWKRRNELVGPFAEAAFKLQVRSCACCLAAKRAARSLCVAAVAALQVNQMSDIIKTQHGYHLILCEGRKA